MIRSVCGVKMLNTEKIVDLKNRLGWTDQMYKAIEVHRCGHFITQDCHNVPR